VRSVYDLVAANYATGAGFFDTVAHHLIEIAELPPGRVLDVACGRGAVANQLEAQRHDIDVYAADLSFAMLRANRSVANAGWAVRQVNALAESQPFASGVFDAVICSQALPFFADPGRAVREFRRIARPGGVVAVSTNGPSDPRLAWLRDLLPPVSREESLVVEPLAEADALCGLLEGSGLRRVRVRSLRARIGFEDANSFWSFAMTTGLRAAFERIEPESRGALRHEVTQGLERMSDGAEIYVLYRFHIAVGTVES
jgi:SAM-dependent methyltransferase